jgi:NAD(P) transhydrogenase subunit alpha
MGINSTKNRFFAALDKVAGACQNIALKWGGARVDFISILSIFVLACFVGYYVVWSVTPALHTPLMSVTNAISSVIVVGALIAAAAAGSASSKWLGLIAVALASVNIFGGFAVTARMLAMYKKKERRDA